MGPSPLGRAATEEIYHATSEKVNGENKIEWHKIIVWERLCDVAKNYLSKGRMVCVEGKIQSREFNSDGNKRKVTEIIATNLTLCDSKHSEKPFEKPAENISDSKFDDDDIPF